MEDRFDANRINEHTFKKLEGYIDNFQKIADVKTDLLYGDISREKVVFLSVIIPTFNRSNLLKEAINSVLDQKTVDYEWELLVIDNTPLDEHNSTPALKIITDIGSSSVLYYHNRINIGSGYNWNRGVELARGKWIMFLHDDDVLCSDALLQIRKIIVRDGFYKKPLGYIHANRIKFSDDFDEKQAIKKRWPLQLQLTQNLALFYGHTGTGAPSCGTTILREAYMNAGGINYDYGPTADAILGYQIMKKYTVVRSARVLGGYRWLDNETLKKDTILKLLSSDRLFAKYRYEKNQFGSMWGKIFGDVIEYNNYKMKICLCNNHELIFTVNKKKFFLIRSLIYRILFGIYMIIRIFKSIGL